MKQIEHNPLFSVIITSFNRAKLLERAVNSLIEQTEKSWEAIIVDDGSQDNTSSYAYELCIKDPRFSYLFQDNRGTGLARNAGISLASGEYITFLDSDDEYLQEHLATRKHILTANPDIDLLHGGVEIIGDPYVPDINNPEEKIHLSECVIGGTFFIKRDIIKQIGGFPNVRFGDDSIFFATAKEKKLNIEESFLKTYRYYCNGYDSLCKIYFQNKINNL